MLHKDKNDEWNISTPLGNISTELVKDILKHEPFFWDQNNLSWVFRSHRVHPAGKKPYSKPAMFDLMEEIFTHIKQTTNKNNNDACCTMLQVLPQEKLKRGL